MLSINLNVAVSVEKPITDTLFLFLKYHYNVCGYWLSIQSHAASLSYFLSVTNWLAFCYSLLYIEIVINDV
jgi:hypothetical protein